MPAPADAPVPAALAYRLRPGERVLWWGRPGGPALRPRRDAAMLPLIGIAAVTALVILGVPGPTWHWAVTTIFRVAIASSALSLSVTFLVIVVRQRRQQVYAITRERALNVGGFWAGGMRAWPLRQVSGVRVDEAGGGRGTVWFGVEPAPVTDPLFPPAAPEPVRPRFERVADAADASAILAAAAAAWRSK
jgi:hypothetical protein